MPVPVRASPDRYGDEGTIVAIPSTRVDAPSPGGFADFAQKLPKNATRG